MDFANEARIEISTLCNHDCIFCSHRDLKRKKEIISDELFRYIISEVQKEESITQITFSGFGEILTDNKIISKIKYVKSLGYTVNILTNGTLLQHSTSDDLLEYVDNIRISIHTLDRDRFKEITNYDGLDNLLDNLHHLSQNKHGCKLIVSAVSDDNYDDLLRLKDVVDVLEIWKPHNWADTFDYRTGDRAKKSCGRPFRGPLQIQVDGTVNMCCFDYDGKLILGDLKTQTIDEVFSSDAYLSLRKMHETGSYKNILCEKCDQRIEYDGLLYSSLGKTKEERENMFSSSYNKIKK